MTDMTLAEAIAEAKHRRTKGYSQYDLYDFERIILNAVASGDLILKADAEMAVALEMRIVEGRAEAAEAEVARLK